MCLTQCSKETGAREAEYFAMGDEAGHCGYGGK